MNKNFIDRVVGVLLESRLDEKNRAKRDQLDKMAAKRLGLKGDPTSAKNTKAALRKKLSPQDNIHPEGQTKVTQDMKRSTDKGWIRKNKAKAKQNIANREAAVEKSKKIRHKLP